MSELLLFKKRILSRIKQKNIKVVSFDVFDTLLHRSCPPDAVIGAVNVYVLNLLGTFNIEEQIEVISEKRTLAYLECANKNSEIGLDQETNTLEFFPLWGKLLGLVDNDSTEFASLVQLFEENLERDVISSDNFMVSLVQEIKELGVRVIYCSDMYLPKKFIGCLLESNGYLFDGGYVSSEAKLLKRSGKLFAHVLREENILPTELIHVGDNLYSDYIMARQAKIFSLWLFEKKQVLRRNMMAYDLLNKHDNDSKSCLLYELGGYFNSISNYPYILGRTVFGPVVACFINKVQLRAIELKLDKVFFFAREGYVLKKTYDQLKKVNTAAPPSEYLAISRLVCLLYAFDKKLSLRELTDIFANLNHFTIKAVLQPFGIPYDDIQKFCQRYSLDCDGVLPPNFVEWHPFIRLCEDIELNQYIVNKVNLHQQLFNKYLSTVGFFDADKVAVVDIGWGGQIQDNLFRGMELTAKSQMPKLITGIYLALNERAHRRKQANNWMEWVISDVAHLEWNSYICYELVYIFEAFVRAPHPTVIGFTQDENKHVEIKLKDHDNHSRLIELYDENNLILLQDGVIDFVKKVASAKLIYPELSLLDLDRYVRTSISIMGRLPNTIMYEWMSKIGNVADLGSDSVNVAGKIAGKISIFNLRGLLKLSPWQEYLAFAKLGWMGSLVVNLNRYRKRIPSKHNGLVSGVVVHSIAEVEGNKTSKSVGQADSEFYANIDSIFKHKLGVIGDKGVQLVNHIGTYVPYGDFMKNYLIYKLTNKFLKIMGKHQFYNGGLSISYLTKRYKYAYFLYFKQKAKYLWCKIKKNHS